MSMEISPRVVQKELEVIQTGLENLKTSKKQVTQLAKATELGILVDKAMELQSKVNILFNKKITPQELASAELLRNNFNEIIGRLQAFSKSLQTIPGGAGKMGARKKQAILTHGVFERVKDLKPITTPLKVDTMKMKHATMEKTPSKVSTLRMKYETMGTPSKTDTVIMRGQSQAERRRSQTDDEINAVLNDITAMAQAEEALLKTELPTLKSERAVLKEEMHDFRTKINRILKEFPRPGLLSPLQMAEIQFIGLLVKDFDKTFRQGLQQAENSAAGIRKVRDKMQKFTNVEQRLEQFEKKYSAFFDTYTSTMNMLTGMLKSYPHLQDVRNETLSLLHQLKEKIFDQSTLEPWGDDIMKLLRSDFGRTRARLSIIYDKAQNLLARAESRLRVEDPRAKKMLTPLTQMIEELEHDRKLLEKYAQHPKPAIRTRVLNLLEKCKELELECQSVQTSIYEIEQRHLGNLDESISDLLRAFLKFRTAMEAMKAEEKVVNNKQD